MSETIRNRYDPDTVSAPGETLQEVLEERGMTQANLADRTGRPTKTINEIIRGKAAITPDTALQFEFVLGIPAAFWNNRERQYREFLAKQRAKERLESQTDWLDRIPYNAMVRARWIPSAEEKTERLHHALQFFGIASPSNWKAVWNVQQAAFRQSVSFDIDPGAVAAWLRKGEIEAQRAASEPFEAARFRATLHELRTLSRELPKDFAHILAEKCGKAGVRVVFVPELPKTRVWGASRWLSPSCALIQLSLRYKTDDHFWFTFFHEAAHILLHGKREFFIDRDDQERDQKEFEADSFACDWLIPPQAYKAFRRLGARSCAAISRFAYEQGIAPGIAVGRLQHDGLLPRTHCNHLKRPLTWAQGE